MNIVFRKFVQLVWNFQIHHRKRLHSIFLFSLNVCECLEMETYPSSSICLLSYLHIYLTYLFIYIFLNCYPFVLILFEKNAFTHTYIQFCLSFGDSPSTDVHNSQDWTRYKPGTSTAGFFYMGETDSNVWVIRCFLLGHTMGGSMINTWVAEIWTRYSDGEFEQQLHQCTKCLTLIHIFFNICI